ncbi:MAG: dihydroorotase family protein [Armatimonadetes bacterium]|nr:dihydroorotase family protein [Armatimonadota bacterium]
MQRALALGERTGATLYFCHVSTAAELALLREAKAKGQPVYVEAAPHHLLLSEEDLAALGNFGKVNPPLRSAADRAALWAAIEDGTVDTLGTDHAPHPRAAKEQPYPQAPSGMPGLEVALPLMLTALSQGRLSFQRLVELTSARAAALFGIRPLDWVLVDMETVQTLQAGQPDQSAPPTPQEWGEPDQSAPPVSGGLGGLPILSRCGWSPYVGWRLRGWPLYVWVNGELAYDRGRFGLAGLGREVVFRRR